MSEIVGWTCHSPHAIPPATRATLDRLAADSDNAGSLRSLTVATDAIVASVSGRAGAVGAGTFGGAQVAFVGRPQLSTPLGTRAADAETIAERFKQTGTRVLDELRGAFALAVFDSERAAGFVATDPMGICPLFVVNTPDGVAFSSAPETAARLAGMACRIRPQAVYDYLYSHVVPAPSSILEGVRRLLPGECVEWNRAGSAVRRYWTARFEEHVSAGFGELRTGFIDALRASVRDAMHGAKCGAFLSGGTDSSTIAGLMTQIGGEPARTYSIGFEAEGFDEMDYARLASRHFGTQHHEYYVTPRDVAQAAPLIAATHPQPFGNSSAVPAYLCARLAHDDGVERMLGGDGGDELFGGNARYAKQRVFSYYEALPAPLRKSVLEPVARWLPRRRRPPGIGKVISYIRQAAVPMPDRLEAYNLMEKFGPASVLTESILGAVDPEEPMRVNRDAYFNPSAASLINRMLALDFKTTLADNDLPKVMQSCRLARVAVDFPMLDPRVVDFSLRLAPDLKLKGTRLRYFFKQALRGFLPVEIINKQKHGFGLPFGEWALRDPELRALAFDSLNALKRRDYVRPGFIDHLKDDLLPQFPNYYGTLVWVLMMLELWLQSHQERLRAAHSSLQAHAQPT